VLHSKTIKTTKYNDMDAQVEKYLNGLDNQEVVSISFTSVYTELDFRFYTLIVTQDAEAQKK
jgi:hypothetical protein